MDTVPRTALTARGGSADTSPQRSPVDSLHSSRSAASGSTWYAASRNSRASSGPSRMSRSARGPSGSGRPSIGFDVRTAGSPSSPGRHAALKIGTTLSPRMLAIVFAERPASRRPCCHSRISRRVISTTSRSPSRGKTCFSRRSRYLRTVSRCGFTSVPSHSSAYARNVSFPSAGSGATTTPVGTSWAKPCSASWSGVGIRSPAASTSVLNRLASVW